MQIQKFICQQCGECCSHIRGRIDDSLKEFMNEYAYGKMPLVQLIPVEKMSFPLWDWEAKRFMQWQKEVDIGTKISPSRVIYDLNTHKAIIVTYYIDSDDCPFLRDKKCLIYNKKRAYICRLFPFNKGPFLKTDEATKENMFGSCPAIKDIRGDMPEDKKEMVRYLSEAFPDGSFLNVVQHDIVTEWINKITVDLTRNKIIRPAVRYPYDKLLKRIGNSEKTDLTEFLVEKEIYTREEMDKLIKGFDDNTDAKEKIKECLG